MDLNRNSGMTLISALTTCCALMSLAPVGAHANDAMDLRMATVIAHIQKNPVNELPVGKHPKKPKRIFCRLFNISLSARAYFQLHTDPALDASSTEMLLKVARWYLANPNKVRDPDSAYWAGEYHSAILAKFGSRGTERKGAIPREAELLMLEYMLDYVNYWSRLGHYDASLKYETYYYWSTENHWWQEIVTAWGYLLALKDDPDFKDRTLDDGKSLQEHYERTCHYMKQHMRQRASKGFLLEISSGGYSSRMHNMWYMIYDISPDPNMRKLARNTLDLYWAFWAEEQIAGERGGGKVRHRGLRGLGPNTGRHLIPAWLYFGAGTLGLDYITQIPPDTIELAMHYTVLLSGYRPDEVIYKVLEDGKTAPPYPITQRRLGKQVPPEKVPETAAMGGCLYDVDQGDCLKYSWVTPDFILGTVMRPPYDGKAWQKGTAQGWWHGLLISSGGPHDPPERVVPTFMQSKDISSDQYAVQAKGSFMTRKLAKGWGRDNSSIPMGAFISKGLAEHAVHKGDFIFVNTPQCWVAIRSLGTDFVQSDGPILGKHKNKDVGVFYRLKEDHLPLVIEAATPGDYETFDAFKSAATQAAALSEDGAHTYSSLSGDQFTMFDDRSHPLVNGEPLDYNPAMAYDSPFVSSKWDSGIVTLTAGGMETTLDFNPGSVTK